MENSKLVGVTFAALFLVVVGLSVQTWLLGMILSWFGVSFSFWQNLAIIILANMITHNSK